MLGLELLRGVNVELTALTKADAAIIALWHQRRRIYAVPGYRPGVSDLRRASTRVLGTKSQA